jgi:hypothetical protein
MNAAQRRALVREEMRIRNDDIVRVLLGLAMLGDEFDLAKAAADINPFSLNDLIDRYRVLHRSSTKGKFFTAGYKYSITPKGFALLRR